MKGGGRAFVKGWVLHPAAAQVATTGLLQVNVKAADTDIWVVMFAGEGQPPQGAVAGEGLNSVLTIPGCSVRFDEKAKRLKAE
jgi:hypothetical protein